jgi:orotate phosphoribosyltransferase
VLASDITAALQEVGALKEGHFLLSSGRHGDRYIEKFELLANPRATEAVCRAFAERFAAEGITVVAGPTTGGILLAFEVGRQLGVRAAYAERADKGDGRAFRRGYAPTPDDRVLVVDDILTTGGSVRDTLDALSALGVRTHAVGILVDRSGGRVDLGVPLVPLLQVDIATFAPDDCPLCRDGQPLIKPGTTLNPGAR